MPQFDLYRLGNGQLVVDLQGTTWIVRVQELAAVPGAELRDPVGSLAEHRDALKRVIDILTDGI